MAGHTEEESPFKLTGAEASFSTKSKDIFASLDALEAKHNAVQKTFKDDPTLFNDDPRTDKVEWKKAELDSQGFKKPGLPAPRSRSPVNRESRGGVVGFRSRGHPRHGGGRGRRSADHHSNPDRWTKYDLSDVPELSEQSNSRAALSFLSEMRARGEQEGEEPEGAEIGKHLFKPPPARPTPVSPTATPIVPSFGPSKRVLPEYVIGMGGGGGGGSRSARPRAVAVPAEAGAVNLNHLDDLEADESASGLVNIPDPASLFASFREDAADEAPASFKKSKSRKPRKRDADDEAREEEDEEEEEEETPIFRSKTKKARVGIQTSSRREKKAATVSKTDSGSEEEDWGDLEELKKDASDDELNQVD